MLDLTLRIPHYYNTKQIIFYHLQAKKSRYLCVQIMTESCTNGEMQSEDKKVRSLHERTFCLGVEAELPL